MKEKKGEEKEGKKRRRQRKEKEGVEKKVKKKRKEKNRKAKINRHVGKIYIYSRLATIFININYNIYIYSGLAGKEL